MSKREEIYIPTREEIYLDNLYKKFYNLLNSFIESEVINWEDKEPILDNFKLIVDEQIRELHSEDLLC